MRRRVAAGVAGLAAFQVVGGLPVGPASAVTQPGEDGPIIWMGTVPGATPDSAVVAQVQRVDNGFPEMGAKTETVIVGSALVDERGVATIRVEPGDWLGRMADEDGRIEVFLTASAERGKKFGAGLTTVLWSTEQRRWTPDPYLMGSGALGDEVDPKGPPSSPITMTDATPEMLRTVEQAPVPLGGRSARSGVPAVPSAYACYGGASVVTGGGWNTMSLGKYAHSGVGPSEQFIYQRTSSSASEWGYKASTNVGAFTASGRIGLASQTTSSAIAGSKRTPDGSDRKYSLNVLYYYERRAYQNCTYAGQPPACGGACGFNVNLMRPYRWSGDVDLTQVGTDRPTGDGVDRAIGAGNTIGRASGRSTTVANSAEVGVGSSVLSASLSYTSSSGSGTTVTRLWENGGSGTKFINGRSGDPQWSGTPNVWAHG